MRTVVHPLSFSTLPDLAGTAATSMFWAIDPADRTSMGSPGASGRFEKELWLHNLLTTWGTCGYTAYVTSGNSEETAVPAATIFFAPPGLLPGCRSFPTAPVSSDAILISTVHVRSAYAGLFLEHRLIDAAVDELSRRGVRAVECFAKRPSTAKVGEISASCEGDRIPRHAPILWTDIVEDRGFEVVQDHAVYPRYRRELTDTGNLFAAVEESLWNATVTMGMGMKQGMGVR